MKLKTIKTTNYLLRGNIKIVPYLFRKEDASNARRENKDDFDDSKKIYFAEEGIRSEGTFKQGFMIHNESGEQFVLCYDDDQQCCEDFKASEDIFTLTSDNGCEIEVQYTREEDADEDDLFTRWLLVNVKVNGVTKLCKKIWNRHNGYYCHAVVFGSIEKDSVIIDSKRQDYKEYTYILL